jgi:hypothetical protein
MNELCMTLFCGEECEARNQAWIKTLHLQGSFIWTAE